MPTDEQTPRVSTGDSASRGGAERGLGGGGGGGVGDDAPAHRYGARLATEIEAKWQDVWERERVFCAPNPGEAGFDGSRPKKFVLDMFPYPSGAGLHVGHPLGYIATDIYARYLRMTGHNVLHAMGFDAFGLPAEQYAVQTGTHPRVTTERNISTMRRQLRRLGLGHDARRSVATTDPGFYRWTQWIFLKVYGSWFDPRAGAGGRARPVSELVAELESGKLRNSFGLSWSRLTAQQRDAEIDSRRLAYLAEVPVNWCPMLGTVLANEEVTSEGRSERGNYPVYKRPLRQWMMRITAYAERLLADLDDLDWPEAIKLMQRNWIGRSRGAFVDFECGKEKVRVYTTRPDTLFGATYMVLSPEHELVDRIVTDRAGKTAFAAAVFPGAEALVAREATPREMVEAYRAYAAGRAKEAGNGAGGEEREKTGVFTGAYAINPANGARVPVFIADYVLTGYGTGAIMAVPGQDERDWAFAERFGLPIVRTVRPPDGFVSCGGKAYTEDGPAINSGFLDGLTIEAAKARMIEHLEKEGKGKGAVQYKLRDWLFSRQRYWGEPFPVVYEVDGRVRALPESMLPVELPALANFQPESSEDADAPPRPPLARAKEWVKARLDLGDGEREYVRETNTMPNWAGSCWYYLRYVDPENSTAMVGSEAERYWMGGKTEDGVDLYVGGVEHAVLHLLYARFWHKVLFDLGHVSTREPFRRLFNQGYIQAFAYTDDRGVYVEASQVTTADGRPASEAQDTDGPFFFEGKAVKREYGKMGKSLKNAVAPDEVCEEYGCDTLRVYEMSMGPLADSKPWNTRDIAGAHRFLQRVWRNVVDEKTGGARVVDEEADTPTRRLVHKTILGVRRDMEGLSFNTAVSKLIELNNALTKLERLPREAAEALVLMLSPLAPHMCEELWERLGHAWKDGKGMAHAAFPVGDEKLAADDTVEVPVSVQGKVRGKVTVAAGSDAATLEKAALANADVAKHLEGKAIKKVIVVPGKMVNIVVG